MQDFKLKYLKELSKSFPTPNQVSTEIINLSAVINLPKGTEHFISDIHGEYEMFLHILKTASGVIKNKIDQLFARKMSKKDRNALAMLTYYPEEKLKLIDKDGDFYRVTLLQLIDLTVFMSAKYTRSKVRRMLPRTYSYIIDELLNCDSQNINKELYYNQIIDSVIDLDQGDEFIKALCNLIQNLAIDHLHIVGDIFDRGKRPDIIMDYLMNYYSIDIQWGNHDVCWIGASLGSEGCILTLLCDAFKYGNFDMLEEGYAINLLPLYEFVHNHYDNDDCAIFKNQYNNEMSSKMYKAIAIMRFKVEDELKRKYKVYGMEKDTVLDKIDLEKGTFKNYKLKDCNFPTLKGGLGLTEEESVVLKKLVNSFKTSEKLKKHINFLLSKGSIYLRSNGNLLYHACIPLDENGQFLKVQFDGKEYYGKNYMDFCEEKIRRACALKEQKDVDFIWQLWCGKVSPFFGKDKMATFENIFLSDSEPKIEKKQHYFNMQDSIEVCNMILTEFELSTKSGHIINGHIPIKYSKGESPIKANGKMIVIDGGMSKPYQKVTGGAGYTLLFNSYGLAITQHNPFLGKNDAIKNNIDDLKLNFPVENRENRIRVKDTDKGKRMQERINDLKELLACYRQGLI